MGDDPRDWVHIGERELKEIEASRRATQSPVRRLMGRGLGATILGHGVSVGPEPSPSANKFELARATLGWLRTSRQSASIDDNVLRLPKDPTYLFGAADFATAIYHAKSTEPAFTHAIVYSAEFTIYGDAQQSGLIVLVGSLRHSKYARSSTPFSYEWTPSTYEGLKHLIYLGRGDTPATFDPISTLERDGELLDRLSAEALALSRIAKEGPTHSAQFAARIHALIRRESVHGADLQRHWTAAFRVPPMPDLLLVGAPLWIYDGDDRLI